MQPLCEIENWINSLVNNENEVEASAKLASLQKELTNSYTLEKLKGDASCRSYYRLVVEQPVKKNDKDNALNYAETHSDIVVNYIVVASPVDRIDNAVFIDIANHWRTHGVNTPLIYYAKPSKGLMLIEDFGATHLYDLMNECSDVNLYEKAIKQLINIQQIPSTKLPAFDRDFLLREMNLFNQWMVEYQLELQAPECVGQVFELLIDNALNQPQVAMHRDFHSRNLLLINDEIAVIDFQDAVRGPLAYDLVSLLKDCYLDLSEHQKNLLIDSYLELLFSSKALTSESVCDFTREEFVRWFDLIGMQRHLKVLGLFIRLGVEERKTGYLQDLPRVFNYVISVAKKYPQLSEFHAWLETQVKPKLAAQIWYQS